MKCALEFIGGRMRLVWFDTKGDGLPMRSTLRAYRQIIYRVPVVL